MSDDRRITADRFYGGVTHRLENLEALLRYLESSPQPESAVNRWVRSNTSAGSADAVSHHLNFLDAIDIIATDSEPVTVGTYGAEWLESQDQHVLYRALTAGVKGFDTVLEGLNEEPMTDADIMELLTTEITEANMETPGPAARHREWLQVLGYVDRTDGVNRITPAGEAVLTSNQEGSAAVQPDSPDSLTLGEQYDQAEIENAFDTGFGYQISGINPRNDANGDRYILLFAKEDGPYDDAVRSGNFEYVGEGQTGDQNPSSPGNSVLIDAADERVPIHFFYQSRAGNGWEYQGLVDVTEFGWETQDGRDVLVFSMEHRHQDPSKSAEHESPSATQQDWSDVAVPTDDPTLTDDLEYTESRRAKRDPEFVSNVLAAYENTCAVCGASRESPSGRPEVEAAHIKPKQAGGPDDVRNGLALCNLHHWAFDAGWIGISDSYTILVREAPDREGFYEFKQLEGDHLNLPNKEGIWPAEMYLEAHRELHGFG